MEGVSRFNADQKYYAEMVKFQRQVEKFTNNPNRYLITSKLREKGGLVKQSCCLVNRIKLRYHGATLNRDRVAARINNLFENFPSVNVVDYPIDWKALIVKLEDIEDSILNVPRHQKNYNTSLQQPLLLEEDPDEEDTILGTANK
ncbi:MAG: hypothetical protein R3E91_05175 [Chlamydiales bacterium]